MSVGRRLLAVANALPVTVLAAIAGAGSFTHIRDTAAQHGQRGPMSWVIAVSIDLTCVMAARERHRDQRHSVPTRRLSWPTAVLTAGVLLSLAANLAQAQPTAWGQIMAATPSTAFLTAVSMLERRAATRHRTAPVAAPPAVPDGTSNPGRTSRTNPDPVLLEAAGRAAAGHQHQHGQPITRDALRVQLGISNQLASDLLRHIRNPGRR